MDGLTINKDGQIGFTDLFGRFHLTTVQYNGPYKVVGTAGVGFKSFEGVLLNNNGYFRAYDGDREITGFGEVINQQDFEINKHCYINEYYDVLDSKHGYFITLEPTEATVILWRLYNDKHVVSICPITGRFDVK